MMDQTRSNAGFHRLTDRLNFAGKRLLFAFWTEKRFESRKTGSLSAVTMRTSPSSKRRNALRSSMSTKVGMVSLGCAKNLVDAEIMLGSVLERGMEITSSADDADVLVINTCAFIDSAKEESIEAILSAHQGRGLSKRPGQKLIVSGCMSQRFARELREEMPEVDAFIGLDQVSQLGEIIEKILRKRPTLNSDKSRAGVQHSLSGADRSPLAVGRWALDVDSDDGDVDLAFAETRPTYIPDYNTPRFRLTP